MNPQTSAVSQRSKPCAEIRGGVSPDVSRSRLDAAHQVPTLDFVDTLDAESLDEVGERLACAAAVVAACRVLVAVHDPANHRFELIGDSHGLEESRRLPIGDPFEQALTESRILASQADGACRETTVELQTPVRAELAHRHGVTHARVCLLADRAGNIQGAFILLRDTAWPEAAVPAHFGTPLVHLASYLRLRREAAATGWHKVRSSIGRRIRTRRTLVLAAGALLLGGVLITPAPHHVSGHCQCEPATRRLLTAPFDAQLSECLVKPGDRVSTGQILATFEGTEIGTEIESLTAERKQAQQRHDAAMVAGEASLAAESSLELQRICGRLKLLRDQQSRLQLQSPVDGVVVSGDLEASVGATIPIGQRLLEVAPLDRMIAEIEIDESDVTLIAVGQRVSLQFNGCPGVGYDATLKRIFPRSEVIDGENVYVAEAQIEGDVSILSPGMRGRAKVHVDARPLGSTMFRKPYSAVLRYWGWY
jgi:multidrug efflux pump subunit AcrA (membrane-fusion protein)